jgi:hypothetical protein
VCHALVALDDVVEDVGNASERPVPFGGQPDGCIASLQRGLRIEDDRYLGGRRRRTLNGLHVGCSKGTIAVQRTLYVDAVRNRPDSEAISRWNCPI